MREVKMIVELWFVFALSISSAQADLAKYIDRAATTLEADVIQHSFGFYVLRDALAKYRNEAIRIEITTDFKEVSEYISSKIPKVVYPEVEECEAIQSCQEVGASVFKGERDDTSLEYYHRLCVRWAKFDQLVKLFRNARVRQSNTPHNKLRAVEDWVHLVREQSRSRMVNSPLAYRRDELCSESDQQPARDQAREDFHTIESYNYEQLEKAANAMNLEVAADDNAQELHDAQMADDARELITERLTHFMAEFEECWDSKIDECRQEAAERAKKKKKKNVFSKAFICFGNSCS